AKSTLHTLALLQRERQAAGGDDLADARLRHGRQQGRDVLIVERLVALEPLLVCPRCSGTTDNDGKNGGGSASHRRFCLFCQKSPSTSCALRTFAIPSRARLFASRVHAVVDPSVGSSSCAASYSRIASAYLDA